MNALDTNVWLYAHDGRDLHKQALAQDAVANIRPLALPWQVGCEFVAASRKLAAFGFTESHAWAGLALMRRLVDAVLLPDPDDWTQAQQLQSLHQLSFWDALLVATCLRYGIRELYTEDMGAPRTIGVLALVNPFAQPSCP